MGNVRYRKSKVFESKVSVSNVSKSKVMKSRVSKSNIMKSNVFKSRKDHLHELSPHDRLAKGYAAHRHDI